MPIKTIYSFLTYARKGKADDTVVSGTEIPPDEGKLCKMLGTMFANARTDCTIPIVFSSENGKKENGVRNELMALIDKPSLDAGKAVAIRLQQATTGNSGMGLLFISIGDDGAATRIVVSRFPADEGVVAERDSDNLTVEFVDQVFLKSAHAYKAATYLREGKADDMWKGHAIDKQMNNGSRAVADYWIVDFLKSDLQSTPAGGTRRLAQALRAVLTATDDPQIKTEITAAVQLAGNIPDKALTIAEFGDEFHFSPKTKEAIAAKVNPARLVNEKFKFDSSEFSKHLAYKQIELDNGAVLTAPAEKFDTCFAKQQADAGTTFSTTGQVVDERLRTVK